jgi:chromosomal replication initiator protein
MSQRQLKQELTHTKQTLISMGMYIAELEDALKKRGYMEERIQGMRKKHNLNNTYMGMGDGDIITFDKIMNLVCLHYKADSEDIKGKRRFRHLVNARHMFCYLVKKNMPQSTLKEIGAYLGGRDHSSIIHGQQNTTSFLTFDKAVQRDYQQIIKSI